MIKKTFELISSSENRKNVIILITLILIAIIALVFIINRTSKAVPLPEGCNPGDKFSQTTGRQCKDELFPSCVGDDLFDRNTGAPCPKIE